ncbi:MAG: PEP-CTERM sorting domain-containing protein [Planctomycetaceae bacterium]|jgi:hypothetical protein|nr:PEP-CTERM sorting domain-containing protein [Planctomycetaceae bacterium]
MKFYIKWKEIGFAIILMGLSGFVFADLDSGSSKSDYTSPSGDAISFDLDDSGDQESLGDCTMNPSNGTNSTEAYLEDPTIPESELTTDSFTEDASAVLTAAASFSSDADQNQNTGVSNDGNGGNNPNLSDVVETPEDDSPAMPTTPEPATLLIVGVSLAGFVPLVKRYRRKQIIR